MRGCRIVPCRPRCTGFFLAEREVIAVCGTHGKTTTTACLAHILVAAGLDPSFLVGGVSVNYDSNYRLGAGRYFVIEGDEYDSAFFEKTPKFMAYGPIMRFSPPLNLIMRIYTKILKRYSSGFRGWCVSCRNAAIWYTVDITSRSPGARRSALYIIRSSCPGKFRLARDRAG
jgi:hypothetical protein